jgi:hypothetical protein
VNNFVYRLVDNALAKKPENTAIRPDIESESLQLSTITSPKDFGQGGGHNNPILNRYRVNSDKFPENQEWKALNSEDVESNVGRISNSEAALNMQKPPPSPSPTFPEVTRKFAKDQNIKEQIDFPRLSKEKSNSILEQNKEATKDNLPSISHMNSISNPYTDASKISRTPPSPSTEGSEKKGKSYGENNTPAKESHKEIRVRYSKTDSEHASIVNDKITSLVNNSELNNSTTHTVAKKKDAKQANDEGNKDQKSVLGNNYHMPETTNKSRNNNNEVDLSTTKTTLLPSEIRMKKNLEKKLTGSDTKTFNNHEKLDPGRMHAHKGQVSKSIDEQGNIQPSAPLIMKDSTISVAPGEEGYDSFHFGRTNKSKLLSSLDLADPVVTIHIDRIEVKVAEPPAGPARSIQQQQQHQQPRSQKQFQPLSLTEYLRQRSEGKNYQ